MDVLPNCNMSEYDSVETSLYIISKTHLETRDLLTPIL